MEELLQQDGILSFYKLNIILFYLLHNTKFVIVDTSLPAAEKVTALNDALQKSLKLNR